MESTSNINIKIDAKNLSEDEKAAYGDILTLLNNVNLKVNTKSETA